jgi:Protein of unknown function (DUF732)
MGGNARREGARWFTQYVVPVGLLALLGTGCDQASNDDGADVTTTATSATAAGPAAFVAEARAMGFGTKDLASASERELLQLGKVVCDGLGIKGVGFRRVVGRLVQSDACPTPAEATVLVRSAVRNLCPQHAGAIPS